jgi:hypothetical protein
LQTVLPSSALLKLPVPLSGARSRLASSAMRPRAAATPGRRPALPVSPLRSRHRRHHRDKGPAATSTWCRCRRPCLLPHPAQSDASPSPASV